MLTLRFRHIIVELQKENSTAQHKIKLLESENELLKSEAEQLRQVRHFSGPERWPAVADVDVGGCDLGG